jgi:hypothetical protein
MNDTNRFRTDRSCHVLLYFYVEQPFLISVRQFHPYSIPISQVAITFHMIILVRDFNTSVIKSFRQQHSNFACLSLILLIFSLCL